MKLPKLPHNIILVSIDIKSLYTNIPHTEGIEACINYIEKYRNLLPKFTPNKTILKTLFTFVLDNNYFDFENKTRDSKLSVIVQTKVN